MHNTTGWTFGARWFVAFASQTVFASAAFTVVALASPDAKFSTDTMNGRPNAVGSSAELLATNDCWTRRAPADMAGRIPGHVVVTRAGARAPVYAGARTTGAALAQIFDGVDSGLAVHGFCR